MDGSEHVVNRNFTIYPRHKNLLDKINEENNSQARGVVSEVFLS
jgi:chorismate mutase